jgi:hypothetical protein
MVLGGPFNSGILATGTRPADGSLPYFNYAPASEIVGGLPRSSAPAPNRRPAPGGGAAVGGASCRRDGDSERAASGVRCEPGFRDANPREFGALRERALVDPARRFRNQSAMSGQVDAHHHAGLDRGSAAGSARHRRSRPFTAISISPTCGRYCGRECGDRAGAGEPTLAETRFRSASRNSDGLVRASWLVDLGAADAIETLAILAGDPLLKSIRCCRTSPILMVARSGSARARGVAAARLAIRYAGEAARAEGASTHARAPSRSQGGHDHAPSRTCRQSLAPWADDLARSRGTRGRTQAVGPGDRGGSELERRGVARYRSRVQCLGERLLWGSDWPVVTLAASYSVGCRDDTLLGGVCAPTGADLAPTTILRLEGE